MAQLNKQNKQWLTGNDIPIKRLLNDQYIEYNDSDDFKEEYRFGVVRDVNRAKSQIIVRDIINGQFNCYSVMEVYVKLSRTVESDSIIISPPMISDQSSKNGKKPAEVSSNLPMDIFKDRDWMPGIAILQRKWSQGDYLEYNNNTEHISNDNSSQIPSKALANDTEHYHLSKLISVNYEQSVIITKDAINNMYHYHCLQDIYVKLPPSSTANTTQPPSDPLPPPPPIDDGIERIDFALALFYKQSGIKRKYENKDGKGKFMEYIKDNGMDSLNIVDVLGDGVESCDCIDFDPKLFKNCDDQQQKVYDLLDYCYKYGTPKENALYDPTEIIMNHHKAICKHIEKEIEIIKADKLPLHLWNRYRVFATIRWWIYNDLNHIKNMRKVMDILAAKHSLNGETICSQTPETTKFLLEKEFTFMTNETLNKIQHAIKVMRKENPDYLKSKSAAEIGYILYNAPINNLLTRILRDDINGAKFIEGKGQFIITETGWDYNEMIQLRAVLLRHETFTKSETNEKIAQIMDKCSLPNTVKTKIKELLLTYNLQKLNHKLRHNGDIEQFGDAVINLVDDLVHKNEEYKADDDVDKVYYNDNFVRKIYTTIAESFIFTEEEIIQPQGSLLSLKYEWYCNNCGNYNYGQRIDSVDKKYLAKCILCGVLMKESIIMKIRKQPTFTMIKSINVTDSKNDTIYHIGHHIKFTMKDHELKGRVLWIGKCDIFGDGLWYGVKLDSKNDKYGHNGDYKGVCHFKCADKYGVYIEHSQIISDGIGELMNKLFNKCDTDTGKRVFDLSCPNRNDHVRCPSIWRLCRSLIRYKRWIQTVCDKNDKYEDITETIKIDPKEFITDEVYKRIFIESAKSLTHKKFKEEHREQILKMLQENEDRIGEIETFVSKMDKKRFGQFIKGKTRLIPALGGKIYTKIAEKLQSEATKENILKLITDKDYKQIVTESINSTKISDNEITDEQVEYIANQLEHNPIGKIKQFLSMEIKQFQLEIKLTPAASEKIHAKIMLGLRDRIHIQKFGTFLRSVDINRIDQDYHHIIKWHINGGNKTSIKNVFTYFSSILHYDDGGGDTNKCRSLMRREKIKNEVRLVTQNDLSNHRIKDIWHEKHFYVQNQLDIYHSYLVHSDWRYFIKLHADEKKAQIEHEIEEDIDEKEEEEKELTMDIKITNIIAPRPDKGENNQKFISNKADITETKMGDYRFGVEHQHPYIKPIHDSIYDELLINEHMDEETCQQLLIKAITLHQVAITQYKSTLKCKKYNEEYKIVRNDPVDIHHIFAIVLYTDNSKFCTYFRSTYRKTDADRTESDVRKRHRELYYYSKSLFEAIEFFGEYVKPSAKLYHG